MKTRNAPFTFLLTIFIAACSSPSFEDEPGGEFAGAELYPVRSTGFREVHARRDANLSSYRRVNIEPMNLANTQFSGTNLTGTTRNDWQITPRREETLLGAWQTATDVAFSGYERAGSGEGVLRISSELVSVRGRQTSVTGTTPSASPMKGNSVNIGVEFRLHDQAAGTLLAVIRDNRDHTVEVWTRGSGMGMQSLFSSWASLLETRISGR